MRSYSLSILALSISIIALAVAVSHRSNAADEPTRIEIDQNANVVRVVIDGQAVASIDGAGLHVQGDVTYTGIVNDTDQLAGATSAPQ